MKLVSQLVGGILVIGLGCLFYYRLSALGWPGHWRSPVLAIILVAGGIFWIVEALLHRFRK
ncbi:MAG: hypothetical protein J2P56_01885 [Verrucomicrobia bacterium]|nr:hypothetical protein [Verrucomicrobiota bacterium]